MSSRPLLCYSLCHVARHSASTCVIVHVCFVHYVIHACRHQSCQHRCMQKQVTPPQFVLSHCQPQTVHHMPRSGAGGSRDRGAELYCVKHQLLCLGRGGEPANHGHANWLRSAPARAARPCQVFPSSKIQSFHTMLTGVSVCASLVQELVSLKSGHRPIATCSDDRIGLSAMSYSVVCLILIRHVMVNNSQKCSCIQP